MSINFRLAEDNDRKYIYELYRRNKEEIENIDYREKDFSLYIGRNTINKGSKLFIAEIYDIQDIKIIGLCLIFDMGYWAYIDLLIVDKEFRKKGVGSTFLKYIEDYCIFENTLWEYLELCYKYSDDNFIIYKKLINKSKYIHSDNYSWCYKKIRY